MKNNFFKAVPIILAVVLTVTGCNKTDNNGSSSTSAYTPIVSNSSNSSESAENGTGTANDNQSESGNSANSSDNDNSTSGALTVSFGDSGSPFTLHLYDNDTAAAIAKHVGTAEWRLPIYHYDDYENWEVMQYYDVPSRYEIPSAADSISSEKAGEVYYSEPNRIVLFFGDAQVSGEYTKVGYFDYSEEFKSAVENNPVLEGWGNKIVIIQPNK